LDGELGAAAAAEEAMMFRGFALGDDDADDDDAPFPSRFNFAAAGEEAWTSTGRGATVLVCVVVVLASYSSSGLRLPHAATEPALSSRDNIGGGDGWFRAVLEVEEEAEEEKLLALVDAIGSCSAGSTRATVPLR
jgi:hypothetical protein